MNEKPFRILSVDGGGIRGIYPAKILELIQDRLQVNILEKFDMIAGTSTGSIIAAAIAKGTDPKEIVSLYRQDGKEIFAAKVPTILPNFIAQAIHTKFLNCELRSVLEREFEELKLGDIAKPLMLPATDIGSGDVHIFKSSYEKEFTRDPEVRVSEAVLACCSAPTYFNPVKVGNYHIADGGIWANNPTLVSYAEAIHRLQIDPSNIRILSLGTGHSRIAYGTNKKIFWGLLNGWRGREFIEFLLSLQAVSTQNYAKLILNNNQLLRIDFSTDKKLPLDDPSCIDDLVSRADKNFSELTKELHAFFAE